jgi:hypothetical protein
MVLSPSPLPASGAYVMLCPHTEQPSVSTAELCQPWRAHTIGDRLRGGANHLEGTNVCARASMSSRLHGRQSCEPVPPADPEERALEAGDGEEAVAEEEEEGWTSPRSARSMRAARSSSSMAAAAIP